MKIYLDVCCLNRPFDDQRQDRIRLEAESVVLILSHIQAGDWQWISSEAMDFEIEQAPDSERKERVQLLLAQAERTILVEQAQEIRVHQLEALGFHAFDALHLACAESGKVDVFLTTDDRLLRLAVRQANQLRMKVQNPLTWLREVTAK